MTMTEHVDNEATRGRLIAGAAIFVGGQLAPLTIPLVTSSSLPTTWKTALSGLLLLGIPEIAILITIVVLGKSGFNHLKSRIFGSLKETLFPESVSRQRYYFGLVLFLVPLLFGWMSPYVYQGVPDLVRHRLTTAILGDVLLIAGVCLMGGQFWDKLRALVIYDTEESCSSVSVEAP
jgi:Ca2+/H+ antiporter